MFWLFATAVVLIACAATLRPILRRDGDDPVGSDADVYRDQLREVERDLERGLLNPEQAEATRAEVARRLLAASERGEPAAARAPGPANAVATGLTVLLLVVGTGIAYLGTDRIMYWAGLERSSVRSLAERLSFAIPLGETGLRLSPVFSGLGRPDLGDMPLGARDFAGERPSQERFEAEMADLNAAEEVAPSDRDAGLLAELETILANRPDDLTGHRLLANASASLRRYGVAWRAQARVVQLQSDAATVDDVATQLELMIFAARGYVSPEAEQVLARALRIAPDDPRSRYYSGVVLAQNGDPEAAMDVWRTLLAEGPADAPWKDAVRDQMRRIAAEAGLPGPSAADVEAAGDMAPEDRQAMIRSMVEGLAERLATEGGTAAEWARLIRALGVLGQADRAHTIAAEARDVFAGQDDALAQIEDAAGSLDP